MPNPKELDSEATVQLLSIAAESCRYAPIQRKARSKADADTHFKLNSGCNVHGLHFSRSRPLSLSLVSSPFAIHESTCSLTCILALMCTYVLRTFAVPPTTFPSVTRLPTAPLQPSDGVNALAVHVAVPSPCTSPSPCSRRARACRALAGEDEGSLGHRPLPSDVLDESRGCGEDRARAPHPCRKVELGSTREASLG